MSMASTYHHHRLLQQEVTHLLPPSTSPFISNTPTKVMRVIVLTLVAGNFIFLVYYFICLCARRSYRHPEPPLANTAAQRGSDSRDELSGIPVVVIKPSQPPASLSCYESDCCFICLGGFSNGEEVRVLPKCKHIFHMECIDLWLSAAASPSCPVCRVHLIEPAVPPAGPSCRLERSQMLYPVHFPSS